MGIVQGLSEFLPISSSAHLVFTSNFYKVFKGIEILEESNQEIFLDIMLHVGTLIAVLIFFRKEIMQIIKALYFGIKNRDYSSTDFKMGVYILLGTLLTVLIAYPLNEVAGDLVFNPAIVGLLLIVTGAILLVSEHLAKKITEKKRSEFEKLHPNGYCTRSCCVARFFTFRNDYCNRLVFRHG